MRRNQILSAARDVFARHGFGRATMEEIADIAELSPGTIYLYFKSKQELYAGLHADLLKTLADTVEKLQRKKNVHPPDRIVKLMDALYELYEFDSMTLINLFRLQAGRELEELSEETVREMNEGAGRAIRGMAVIFKEGVESGCFIHHKPIAVADIFWSMFSGLILWEESKRLFDPDKRYMRQTLDTAVDILIRGIASYSDE